MHVEHRCAFCSENEDLIPWELAEPKRLYICPDCSAEIQEATDVDAYPYTSPREDYADA